MSEFLAEARILVRPDTTGFRAELEASLATAVKPISIPIVPVVAGTGLGAATGAAGALSVAMEDAAASTASVAGALQTEAQAAAQSAGATTAAAEATVVLSNVQKEAAVNAKELAAAQKAQAASFAQFSRGAGASGLSLLGLRGATLAASGAFLAGTAAVVAFAKSVQSFASFETELNVFAVNAGATADQMARVAEEARSLGRDLTLPGITASDAATAMTELAKAGLSVADAMAAARGTLQLATAAQIDNAAAAKLVSGALNSFELDGTQAVRVADLFAGAAKSAQGSIQDFGPALAQASAVAHSFGISIEDTVTLLTELAKAGLSGGRAGTSLRVALLRLVNPPADAAKALKGLNVQLRDLTTGNIRPQIFTDIEEALQGVSKAQRQATEATIFGSDAVRTQILLGQQGAAAFDKIRAAVTEAGLAQEQAAARTQGLQGDFENLSNQVSGLGLSVGQLASGPVSVLVTKLSEMASSANTAADGLITLVGAVGSLGDKIRGSLPIVDSYVKILGQLSGAGFDPVGTLSGLGEGVVDRAKQTAEGLKQAVTQNLGGLRDTPGLKEFVDNLDQFIGAIEKSGPPARTAIFDVVQAMKDGVNEILGLATKLPQAAQADTGFGVKQIQNIITGFDAKAVRDKIHGDNVQLVADLNAEQDFLERQIGRDFVKRRPALQRLIESALLGTVDDIAAVQTKAEAAAAALKAKAKKAADDAAAAVRDREQALLASFSVARDQRQNQIDADAQKGFLGKQIADEKGLRALVLRQIAAVKERISVEGGRAAALASLRAVLNQVGGQVKALRQQQIDQQKELQASILETQLLRAQATPGTKDDTAILNKQIAAAQKDLNAQKKIAANQKLGSKVRLDAALKVQEDTRKIFTIRQQIKNLSSGGGFSLSDLFKEAINQLNEFGSNVSTAPITAGGARAAVAGGILAQKTGLSDAEKASLNATATTNDLLAQILVAIGPPPNQAQGSPRKVFLVRESGGPEIGVATSQQQRKLGTFVGGV